MISSRVTSCSLAVVPLLQVLKLAGFRAFKWTYQGSNRRPPRFLLSFHFEVVESSHFSDPHHVIDCPDRRLKLFDFGLARRIGSSKSIAVIMHGRGIEPGSLDSPLQGGTLSYMAPECLEVEWESRKPIQRRVSVFGEGELNDEVERSGIDKEDRG